MFSNDELETLKIVFDICKYLESIKMVYKYLKSIKMFCDEKYLKEKEMFEVVSKYSPKNFYELKLNTLSGLLPEELESFFIS